MIAQVANDSLIIGDFNALLENKLLVVVDESESHGAVGASYKFSGRLKNLITEPTTTLINRKGFDAFKVCSCLRVMYCTNTIDALQIDLFDKRFFMLQCNPSRIGQTAFFDQMETILQKSMAGCCGISFTIENSPEKIGKIICRQRISNSK
jgi:hypothetical protein